MHKGSYRLATAFLTSFWLVGCAAEIPLPVITEEPASVNLVFPVIPLEISINARGQFSIRPRLEREIELFDTPLGSITLKAGRKSLTTNLISSLEEQNRGKRLLIIRIDDRVEYYEIEKDKRLDLSFEMDDRLFKRVRIQNDTIKGDETITVSLESVSTAAGEVESNSDALVSDDTSSSNKELKKIEETLLNSNVLITGSTTEFEGEVLEVIAREPSNSIYAMIRWSDGGASSLVLYANKDVLAREEEVDYEIDFEGNWSWNSDEHLQIDMDKGSKYIFNSKVAGKVEPDSDVEVEKENESTKEISQGQILEIPIAITPDSTISSSSYSSSTSLNQTKAVNLVVDYLTAKGDIFGPPYREELLTRFAHSKSSLYRDSLRNLRRLRQDQKRYEYESLEIISLESFSSESNSSKLIVRVNENSKLYHRDGLQDRGNSNPIVNQRIEYEFKKDGNVWKIYEVALKD